jgi:hypothetical protein
MMQTPRKGSMQATTDSKQSPNSCVATAMHTQPCTNSYDVQSCTTHTSTHTATACDPPTNSQQTRPSTDPRQNEHAPCKNLQNGVGACRGNKNAVLQSNEPYFSSAISQHNQGWHVVLTTPCPLRASARPIAFPTAHSSAVAASYAAAVGSTATALPCKPA